MTASRSYLPERDDSILRGLVAGWKLTDAEAAERMTLPVGVISENRERLGLASNPPPVFQKPRGRPDALSYASMHLKGFDREAMTLRGRPIKLHEAMRLTNAELVRKGLPQCDYNPAWLVRP